MSIKLTADEICDIHDYIIRGSGAAAGILNRGMVDQIADIPDQALLGQEIHKDIYSKGSSLFEALIRLHPFIDANKRTALLSLTEYLWKNGYAIILPLSSVRKSVQIATFTKQDDKSNKKLINRTSRWIKKYTFPTKKINKRKIKRGLSEFLVLRVLAKSRLKIFAGLILFQWFAYDLYPRKAAEIIEGLTLMHTSARAMLKRIETEINEEIQQNYV